MVRRDGAEVSLRSRRSAALLGRVACGEAPVPRTTLAAMLWPDSPTATARANLRGLLSHLRRDVGDVLEVSRQAVAWRTGRDGTVDVRRFEALAREGLATGATPALEEAWATYGGDLLAGLALDVDGDFDTWLGSERTRLGLRAVEVLDTLADILLRDGEVDEALRVALELEALEPLREGTQARLLRAAARAGDGPRAVERYEAWAARLVDELGVTPSPALDALADDVRHGRTTHGAEPRPHSVARRPHGRIPHRPLVARDHELARVTACLARADGPDAVVVVGDAGTGKTRLVREALAVAEQSGQPTAWVQGAPGVATLPYAAIAHLAPDVDPGAHPDTASLHRAYTRALLERHAHRPVALVVDDGHVLDAPSAALLHTLTTSGAVRMAVTMRPVPDAPDPVASLSQDGWADRVALEPLTPDEVGRLVAARLDGGVAPLTREQIAAVTRGNPLYVHEVVEGALAEGSLRQVAGAWAWDGTVPAAPRLVDAVGRRIRRLTDEERDALGAVALAEGLALTRLEAITDTDLAGLEARGHVQVDDDGVVRLGHPLHGEVVLEQLGAVGRHRVRRRLVEALEATSPLDADDVLRVATWRLDAGLETDVDELVDAAAVANRAFDHDLAARLADTALARGAGGPAAIERARAAQHRKEWQRAEEVLAAHADELLASTDPEVVRSYLRLRVAALVLGQGRSHAALALLDDAREQPLPAAAAPTSTALRTIALHDLGHTSEALGQGEHLIDADLDPAARAEAARALLGPLVDVGRGDDVQRLVSRHPAPDSLRAQLFDITVLQIVGGNMNDAIVRLRALLADARSTTSHHDLVQVAVQLGQAHYVRGTVADARSALGDAVTHLETADSRAIAPLVWAGVARTEALSGAPAAARRAMDTAEALDRGNPPARFGPDFAPARAWVAAAAGKLTAARDELESAVDELDERPARQAVLLHTALRLGAAPGPTADRLDRIVAGMQLPLLEGFADHARALAAADPGRLVAVADTLEERGQWILAAESVAAAVRCAPPRDRGRIRAHGRRLLGRCTGLVPIPGTMDELVPDGTA